MLRYLDCLMRAHFLTTETADALFIIVDRRISATVIKADGFPFHRAALDADAAFFTFFFYYLYKLMLHINKMYDIL